MNIDRQQFTEWLESKAPYAEVGENHNSTCCPTAVYLNELPDVYDANVGYEWITIYETDRGRFSFELSEWLHDFVVKVDEIRPSNRQVKAWQALEILKELPE